MWTGPRVVKDRSGPAQSCVPRINKTKTPCTVEPMYHSGRCSKLVKIKSSTTGRLDRVYETFYIESMYLKAVRGYDGQRRVRIRKITSEALTDLDPRESQGQFQASGAHVHTCCNNVPWPSQTKCASTRHNRLLTGSVAL